LSRRIIVSSILLVAILAIAAALLAFLMWQKQNDLVAARAQVANLQESVATLETEATKVQKTLATLQGQLTEAQRNSQAMQSQLTEAKQKLQTAQDQLSQSAKTATTLQGQLNDVSKQLDAVKRELAVFKEPPLTAGEPITTKGNLGSFGLVSIPLQLRSFEQVQGEFIAGAYDLAVNIQDPTGAKVQDFGKIRQSNFKFTAQTDGRYVLVIQNPYSNAGIAYTVLYTIYHK